MNTKAKLLDMMIRTNVTAMRSHMPRQTWTSTGPRYYYIYQSIQFNLVNAQGDKVTVWPGLYLHDLKRLGFFWGKGGG